MQSPVGIGACVRSSAQRTIYQYTDIVTPFTTFIRFCFSSLSVSSSHLVSSHKMQGPWLLNASTRGVGFLQRTRNPLKVPTMHKRPLRGMICASVALITMIFLWHRMRGPMEEVGGLIASPPQHEDHPDGHAIVKFKDFKKMPNGVADVDNILVDASVQRGKDVRKYDEGPHNPLSHMRPSRPEHLISQVSSPKDASSLEGSRKHSQPLPIAKPASAPLSSSSSPNQKVAKVSMLHGSLAKSIFHSAMLTQDNHASLHDYPIYIMRNEIVPSCRGLPAKCNPQDAHSLAGNWNKELYLQSILITELAKPDSERVDWLMWQDSDSIIVNPSIPLNIFLPPNGIAEAQNVHLVATKDDAEINTGVFFLRVSSWSVRFLTTCLAVPVTASPYEDLGWSYDQITMATLLEEDDEFKSGVVRQPRRWYNAYGTEEAYAPGEHTEYHGPQVNGGKGKVLNMHFPGMSNEQRMPLIRKWLQRLEEETGWDAPPEETGLRDEIEEFWKDHWKQAKHLRGAKVS